LGEFLKTKSVDLNPVFVLYQILFFSVPLNPQIFEGIFICSGPYASGREKFGFEALAMPRVRGSHLYQSYLIVNKDGPIQTLADLRGRTFAFTDTESNTGKLVPTYWLGLVGERPEDFFGKTIFTYSHDNSLMAVANPLVDGAAVNGQVWEYYRYRDPVFTAKTRVIRKPESFGNPLVVTSSRRPSQMKERMRELLYNMHQDPQGEKILKKLMIDLCMESIKSISDASRTL
jgi:phosphonate transport system substrate-binding protein